MKPYFEYVEIPNLLELSRNLLIAMPREVKYGNIYAEYDPNDFLKKVPGLVEAVELVRPWHELSTVALITQYPKTPWPIHVDGENDDLCPEVAFNIPVYNCEDCYSVIYERKNNANPVFRLTPTTDRPYRTFDLDQVEEVGIINYQNHGVLINTAKPHTIVNPTLRPRIVASFRWNPTIKW